jgi:hypothetical protein
MTTHLMQAVAAAAAEAAVGGAAVALVLYACLQPATTPALSNIRSSGPNIKICFTCVSRNNFAQKEKDPHDLEIV